MESQPQPSPIDTVLNRIKSKMADREGNYGDPTDMFDNIAAVWAWYIKVKYHIYIPLDNHDSDIMMELLKIARNANKYTEDNGDDNVAYGLLGQVMKEIEKNEAPK